MLCDHENCNHETFGMVSNTCACHMDTRDFLLLPREDQVQAVRIAALENDRFDVDAESGDIQLKP